MRGTLCWRAKGSIETSAVASWIVEITKLALLIMRTFDFVTRFY